MACSECVGKNSCSRTISSKNRSMQCSLSTWSSVARRRSHNTFTIFSYQDVNHVSPRCKPCIPRHELPQDGCMAIPNSLMNRRRATGVPCPQYILSISLRGSKAG